MYKIFIVYKFYPVHFKKEKNINSGNPYLEGNGESHFLMGFACVRKDMQ